MIQNDIDRYDAALQAANKLESALEQINTNFNIADQLMDLQQYLDAHISDLKLLRLAQDINHACLQFEDRFSDLSSEIDDVTDLKSTVEQLTFDSQTIISEISKRRGIA